MLLDLRDLSIRYPGRPALGPFSLCLARGETLGVAGESGCGKSTLLRTIAGFQPGLPAPVRQTRIGYVPQDLLASLSPFLTIESHLADAGGLSLLQPLGLDSARIRTSYPHQLSGGELQRIVIALALSIRPQLILADEPTAHLDPATESRVLALLSRSGAALLIASHREDVFRQLACPIYRLTPAPHLPTVPPVNYACATPVLTVSRLSKQYLRRDWLLRPVPAHRAIEDVSLNICAAETVVLAGPSGAGKSTLARCIAGRESWQSGEIHIEGRCQIVPQEPSHSLNPRLTVGACLREACGRADPVQLEQMALPANLLHRPARELSEGQRARVAIARTIAALGGRGLLILDESLSGLDGATRRQVLQSIRQEQIANGLACLLITHDLEIANEIDARTLTIENGRLTR